MHAPTFSGMETASFLSSRPFSVSVTSTVRSSVFLRSRVIYPCCSSFLSSGVRMTLMDQQKVLFAIEKHGSRWDAEYPWLIPAPRESLFPLNDDVFLLFPPEQMP